MTKINNNKSNYNKGNNLQMHKFEKNDKIDPSYSIGLTRSQFEQSVNQCGGLLVLFYEAISQIFKPINTGIVRPKFGEQLYNFKSLIKYDKIIIKIGAQPEANIIRCLFYFQKEKK